VSDFHEVLHPSSVRESTSQHVARFQAGAAHFGLSQTLVGSSLVNPCSLIACCCRSWGSYRTRRFPSNGPCRAHHSVIPSRPFSTCRDR
jgi:hypothetical protein